MSLDLAGPLRAALVGSTPITSQLPAYLNGFPVFTRRPSPADAPYPLIMVSSDVTLTDQDGVNDQRPVIERDIAIYGRNNDAAAFRVVEVLAYQVRSLFHRQRQAITVSGWHVVAITATGPRPAPTDDDQTVGRVVSLSVQLAKAN